MLFNDGLTNHLVSLPILARTPRPSDGVDIAQVKDRRRFLLRPVALVVCLVMCILTTQFGGGVTPAFAIGPSLVQQADAGQSMRLAYSSDNTAGDLLVVTFTYDTSVVTTYSCSDLQGNTYTNAINANDVSHSQALGICYAPNAKAGPNIVTVSWSRFPTWVAMSVSEYSGVSTAANPVDVTASNAGGNGTTGTDAITSTAATTTISGDLIFGAVEDVGGNSGLSAAAGTGFTLRPASGNTSNQELTTEDRVQASSGSIAATETYNAAERYDAGMVAFKPAGAPTFVQQAARQLDFGALSTSLQFSSPTSANNMIVAEFSWESDGSHFTFSCSDSSGNSYTNGPNAEEPVNAMSVGMCYAPVTSPGQSTVTVSFGGFSAHYASMSIAEYSGVLTTGNPVDVTASHTAANNTTATDNVTTSAAVTTMDNDLIIGAFESPGITNGFVVSAGTNFTVRGDDAVYHDDELTTEDRVLTSAGSVSATETFTTANAPYVGIMVAFKPISATANTNLSVTINPSFTFTVGNESSTCNGESNFVSGAGGASTVALGNLAAGANVSGGQALTVAGNSGGGFTVYVAGTQATQNLRSGIHNWTDVAGTYASPAPLGAGERFGYTYHDSTASSSVVNPASANFIALSNSNAAVMGSNSSPAGGGCVSYDAQTSASTPAASYTATVLYTAVPAF